MLCERQNLTPVADLIEQTQAKSFLDVGLGFGTYGVIAREFLDIWPGRLYKNEWKVKIDAIELEETFRSPLWDVCDNVFIGDFEDVMPKLGEYEVTCCLHMIEHLATKEKGEKLFELLEEKTTKRIIIGTPGTFYSTGDYPLVSQQHKTFWPPEEFVKRGYTVVTLDCGDTLAWKDK
jgi:hypothetical protein